MVYKRMQTSPNAEIYRRWVVRASLLIAMHAVALGSPLLGQTAPGLDYRAILVEESGGQSRYLTLTQQGPKYRLAEHPKGTPTIDSVVECYDGNAAGLVWIHSPGRRLAGPSLSSCLAAFKRAVDKLGAEEATRVYGMPGDAMLTRPLPALAPRLTLQPREEGSGWIASGAGVVAGRPGRVFRQIREAGGRTDEWRQTRDRATGLILEYTLHVTFKDQAAPPLRSGFRVVKLEVAPALPAGYFALPAGTTARIPKIFADVPTPKGVIREAMSGVAAGIGVDIRGMERRGVRP